MNRNRCQRTVTVALLALLVAGSIAPFLVGSAAAAEVTERPARLVVEQPHYVDGSPSESRANGTRVYEVRGPVQKIFPQNFESDRVVDFGVTTDGGEMNYEQRTGAFRFQASQTGTYSVYWIVEETVTQNVSANETRTTTQQVRYVARVRVTGGMNYQHVTQSQYEETQRKAQLWEDANATIQDLRQNNIWVTLGLQPPLSTEQTFQAMVDAYLTINQPLKTLTGRTTMYVVLLITGLGGIVLLVGLAAWHFGVVAWLTRQINIFHSVEQEEGEWAHRVEDQELRDRKVSVANQSHQDIYGDDFVASAMREEGRNPVQSFINFWNRNSERGRLKHRLQVMGQHGYRAVPTDDDVRADGGVQTEQVDTSALDEVRIRHEDDLGADDGFALTADVVDDDLLEAIPDWSAPAIADFDLASADWDDEQIELDEPRAEVPMELEDFIQQQAVDRRHFDDDEVAAEYHLELLEHIRRSGLTDDRGDVDGLRVWLEEHLDGAHVLNDRFEIPLDYHIDALEAAIIKNDRREQAKQRQQDVTEGKYA